MDSVPMTWHSAKAECERRGLRLCYAAEALVDGAYRFGKKSGDWWLPVLDGENEWLEIGEVRWAKHGSTHDKLLPGCRFENKYGKPAWGITSKKHKNSKVKRFVIGCKTASKL